MTPSHTGAIVLSARRLLAQKGRTFQLASWLLPRDSRDDAAVVYAFCRRADDLADDHADLEGIEAMRTELRHPTSPLMLAFAEVASRRRIPLQAADDLLKGVASDIRPPVGAAPGGLPSIRAVADDAALIAYAYAVAGTVGLMMARLLGAERKEALPHAVDLGIAMQITNICRDVVEDAALGRVYLPADRLRRVGIDGEHIVNRVRASPEVRRAAFEVVRDLIELADAYYGSAFNGLGALPLRTRRTALAAASLYHGIGDEVLRRGPDGLLGRAVVPPLRKARLLFRALCRAPALLFVAHRPPAGRPVHF